MVSRFIHATDKEIRDYIYELRRELRESLKEVRAFIRESKEGGAPSSFLPNYALKHMAKAETAMRKKAVKYMDRKELFSTYRRLEYVKNLVSSTLEGAKKTQRDFSPVQSQLDQMDKETKKKLWKIYDKVLEENQALFKYRYELMQEIIDTKNIKSTAPFTAEDLAINIDKLYSEMEKRKGGRVTGADALHFIYTELREFLKNPRDIK